MEYARIALQVIVALGLLNVWLVRFGRATPYRAGSAGNMREEFASYGLPTALMWIVGGLKVIIALALLAGIWEPGLVDPAASVLIFLMAGAFLMHLKVKDPMQKSVPSLAMLAMAIAILVL